MPRIELLVDEENTDIRLDVYLSENTPLSRTAIQKLIEKGEVLLNGEVPNKKYKTQYGDQVSFSYEEKTLTDILPQDIPLDIVYEDEDLIVINKPKDMVVHPAAGNPDGTIVNALLYHCKELSDVIGVIDTLSANGARIMASCDTPLQADPAIQGSLEEGGLR